LALSSLIFGVGPFDSQNTSVSKQDLDLEKLPLSRRQS
jgi:hypothetical protein